MFQATNQCIYIYIDIIIDIICWYYLDIIMDISNDNILYIYIIYKLPYDWGISIQLYHAVPSPIRGDAPAAHAAPSTPVLPWRPEN